MAKSDQNFENLLTAMEELEIEGDPYEIGEEYGIFDDSFIPLVNYRVDFPIIPLVRTKSVEEIKAILADYKKENG